jgi:hypothetical protein
VNKIVSKISADVKELHTSLVALAALHDVGFGKFLQRYEFGTAWLSVDQLALMIAGQTRLTNLLRQTRHVTFQTADLIDELAHWHKMQIEAAKGKPGGA